MAWFSTIVSPLEHAAHTMESIVNKMASTLPTSKFDPSSKVTQQEVKAYLPSLSKNNLKYLQDQHQLDIKTTNASSTPYLQNPTFHEYVAREMNAPSPRFSMPSSFRKGLHEREEMNVNQGKATGQLLSGIGGRLKQAGLGKAGNLFGKAGGMVEEVAGGSMAMPITMAVQKAISAGNHLKEAVTTQSGTKFLSHTTGAMSDAYGATPGIGQAFQFANTVFEAGDKLRDWTGELQRSNNALAEWSGAMAGVKAKQEAADAYRDMRKGNARAESAQYLNEGRNRLEDALAPIENKLSEFQNYIGGFLADKLGAMVEGINAILKKLPWKFDEEGETPGAFGGMQHHLQVAARELIEHEKKTGRPLRFRDMQE